MVKTTLIALTVSTVFIGIIIIGFLLDFKTVIKKVQANTMYVAEAIYESETTSKGRAVYLIGYKRSYGGYDLVVREPLKKGDKVIVLQKSYPQWVYKARK